jgi:hypothetical protein
MQVMNIDNSTAAPSVLLLFDKQRYLFNAGEGIQRHFIEHKQRLSRVSARDGSTASAPPLQHAAAAMQGQRDHHLLPNAVSAGAASNFSLGICCFCWCLLSATESTALCPFVCVSLCCPGDPCVGHACSHRHTGRAARHAAVSGAAWGRVWQERGRSCDSITPR